MSALRVTVWNEGVHETTQPEIAAIYPHGHPRRDRRGAARAARRGGRPSAPPRSPTPSTASARRCSPRPTCCSGGATSPTTRSSDEVVERVRQHVLGGMGLIVLHSGHFSKIFIRMLGTTCSLALAQPGGRRARAGLERQPDASDRRGRRAADRDRGAGDVRRVLRHPDAGRPGLHQLVHRRRGVPLRRDVHARPRARSSTSARATRSTRCTSTRRCGACSPTACAGPRRWRASARRPEVSQPASPV